MSTFTDNNGHLTDFREEALGTRNGSIHTQTNTVKVLDWSRDQVKAEGTPETWTPMREVAVQELGRSDEPELRIIFAPLDDHSKPETAALILELVRQYSIPPCFLGARMRAVTREFGTRKLDNNRHATWWHFLCKNINIELNVNRDANIVDPRPEMQNENAPKISQAEGTWRDEAFFLSWGQGRGRASCATLVCFGAHHELQERFKKISGSKTVYTDCIDAPFTFFSAILSELFLLLDDQIWKLLEAFRWREKSILGNTETSGPGTDFDFVGLHNISKHTTHLIESANALAATAKCIHKASLRSSSFTKEETGHKAADEVEYYVELVSSLTLRLASMEKRVNNMINLSFNVVAQRDSKVLQKDSNVLLRDSRSMRTIATVTLLFLPLSTVSTVFGSQFFNFEPGREGSEFVVSPYFAVLWLVAFAATAITWYMRKTSAKKGVAAIKRFGKRHKLLGSKV